jgi:hypothetical protein
MIWMHGFIVCLCEVLKVFKLFWKFWKRLEVFKFWKEFKFKSLKRKEKIFEKKNTQNPHPLFSSARKCAYNPASAARLWRPRFLINVINTKDRISRVKPTEHWSNLGQPGSSPRNPHRRTLLDPLTKSTHTRGLPLVKGTVKLRLNIDVSECRPEFLPRSPNFT